MTILCLTSFSSYYYKLMTDAAFWWNTSSITRWFVFLFIHLYFRYKKIYTSDTILHETLLKSIVLIKKIFLERARWKAKIKSIVECVMYVTWFFSAKESSMPNLFSVKDFNFLTGKETWIILKCIKIEGI